MLGRPYKPIIQDGRNTNKQIRRKDFPSGKSAKDIEKLVVDSAASVKLQSYKVSIHSLIIRKDKHQRIIR